MDDINQANFLAVKQQQTIWGRKGNQILIRGKGRNLFHWWAKYNTQFTVLSCVIVNPFTLIILLIVCHTILLMLVQRIYYWIKKWSSNSPFYSCMLCCQAFAKGDLVMIQKLLLVKSCLLVTGLYHNMVTFSLTPNQRLGN